MSTIDTLINAIRTAVYGKEVRSSIADGIEDISNRQDIADANEVTRQSNETTRVSNENTRQTNESGRTSAETARVNEFNDIKSDYNDAIANMESKTFKYDDGVYTSTVDGTTSFYLNSDSFNPITDVVELYYSDGTRMVKDLNYTINGTLITLSGWTLDSDDFISWIARMGSSQADPPGTDGSDIMDGSIRRASLESSVISDLDKIDDISANRVIAEDFSDTDVTVDNDIHPLIQNELDRIDMDLIEKAKQSDLEIERARIDSFTNLTQGSTTGDAELLDGRVGADGRTYVNIGGALREQIKEVRYSMSNLLTNGDLSNGSTNYTFSNAGSATVSNNELTFTATASNGSVRNNTPTPIVGHKYYAFGQIYSSSNLVGLDVFGTISNFHTGSSTYEFISSLITCSTATTPRVGVKDSRTSGWNPVKFKYLGLIDLTDMYGVDNEPTKDIMDSYVNSLLNKWFNIGNAINGKILKSKIDIIQPLTKKLTIPKTDGFYITSVNNTSYGNVAGLVGANVDYCISDFFSINGKGNTLKTNLIGGSTNISTLAKYDKFGNFIETIAMGNTNTEIEYTLQESEEYFRMSTKSSVASTFEITVDRQTLIRVLPIDYLKSLKDEIDDVRNTLVQDSILNTKKFNIIGDSYVAGHTLNVTQTWSYKIGQKYNMTYRNYGINGNGMVTTSGNGTPVVTRYVDMDNDADYIMVIAGRNDYNYQVPIEDFKAGLTTLCDGLINKYLGKKICFGTPWATNHWDVAKTLTQFDYINAIIEVCGQFSIPVYDMARNSGVTMRSSAFKSMYCLSAGDESHLNELGMDYVMPKFENFLKTL